VRRWTPCPVTPGAEEELEFQEIYKTFAPKMVRYLARLVGEYEAEDLAQEVMVKVSRGLKDFEGKASLSTWIYRIATNTGLDRLRSRSFQREALDIAPENDEGKVRDKDPWTGENKLSLESSLIRKEMNECIRGIVERLPENYRAVLVLSEMEEFMNAEIAEVLGVSVDTVKIRLHRARTMLKKELESKCNFYRDERNELACDEKIIPLKFPKK
jgi:RNA polymerase sigma-70 factor (ECF subfamily)